MSSLVIIKPDAVKIRMVGHIIEQFERDHQIIGLRLIPPGCSWDFSQHYIAHKDKPFYPALMEFMTSDSSVALALRGDAIEIRELALMQRRVWAGLVKGPRNLVHASDDNSVAIRELSIWFPGLQ